MMTADRTKRIKDARTEAQKEIEEYRRQKEEEFKKFEAEVSSPSQMMPSLCLYYRGHPSAQHIWWHREG